MVGYNEGYDDIFDMATSMDTKTYDFVYEGTQHRIWLWKGDYLNLGAGAEVGIYTYGIGEHYFTAPDKALPMQLQLENRITNEQYFDYQPEAENWWITGFDPSSPHVLAENLKATVTIDFSNDIQMWEAFYAAQQDDYPGIFEDNYKVTIEW